VDPEKPDENPRKCPKCDDGELSLKLGKFGAFVGCSNYPECKLTRPFANADGSEPDSGEPKELGTDPTTGGSVTLRSGPYGPYVQLDLPKVEEPKPEPEPEPELDAKGKKKKPKKKKKKAAPKPKRTSIPQGMDQYDVDLAKALQLLSLPREIGNHPESKEMIKAGIGRFGPYLVHKGKFKSIPKDDPEGVLTIGLNRAVILLAQESKGGFGELKKIGEHPTDKVPVTLNRGRFGTYIKCGKTNAPIPKNIEANDITLEKAVELITAKAEKDATKKGTKKAVKKPVKKPAKKKAAAKKKPAAKKKATKKDS
ncbi:MAG: topoisomerase DNA-binding C4 zinc finger domain-containing protein, partial [Gammaproteobacteria bacterium]|nr:topoisomerase DNA-binding C4 zinc finger domain-containing protein [Gammaproteobacteria bacterium]